LDNLPDEDLNRLFEKIAKVKTMRDHIAKPRPESSLSQAIDSLSQGIDDVWSDSGRAFDAFTDDTSVDANGTPDAEGSARDPRDQLESQRAEFESRLQAIGESSEAEDLKAEKHQMEHQLKLIQNQMKRIIDARARGEELGEMEFEPTIYSAKQLKLIRKVLDKWRAHRSFSMAEVVLSAAVVIKEANVIR
jgi:kinesin family protein 1